MALQEFHPDPEKSLWRKLLLAFVLLLLASGLLCGAFFLSVLKTGGVQKTDFVAYLKERFDPKPLEADPQWLTQSDEKVATFERAEHARGLTPDDVEQIAEAVRLREKYASHHPSPPPSLVAQTAKLKKRWHDAASKPLFHESEQSVSAAQLLEKENHFPEAGTLYKQAAEKQRLINNDFPLSEYASAERLAQLERAVADLALRPLYERSLLQEKNARAAIDARQWDNARAALKESTALQLEIINRNPDSSLANMTRLKRLEHELSSFDSLESYAQVQKLIEEAQAAEQNSDFARASERFLLAREKQQRLNETYPDSKFVSTERVENLVSQAQTAQSRESAKALLLSLKALEEALLRRDFTTLNGQLDALLPQLARFREQYPRSRALPEALYERLSVLSASRSELPFIFEQLSQPGILIPVPRSRVSISLKPVSQALLRSLTGKNPSLQPNLNSPANNLSPDDIDLCLKNLSWLLGKTVRLPSPDEIDWASAEPSGAFLAAETSPLQWAKKSSGEQGLINRNTTKTYTAVPFTRKNDSERVADAIFRFVVEP